MIQIRRRACSFLVALAVVPALASSAAAAQFRAESETLLRYFRRDTSGGTEQTVLPLYEYLRADWGELEAPGLSVHAYGWGRHDFGGDFFDKKTDGEVLYGYVQYAGSANNLVARLGRQAVFTGASNESLDGARASASVTPYFAVDAYGGVPLSVEGVDGRGGDRVVGGRFAHHLGGTYEVGLSYRKLWNDGNAEDETLKVDASAHLPGSVSVQGDSARNLRTGQWKEHSYEAKGSFAGITVKPSFSRFDYGAYFDAGKATASPFRFLTGSEETVTALGGDASLRPLSTLEVAARYKHYDYRKREETAQYYAALATFHAKGLSQAGAEVGRMAGDTADNRYTLARAFTYWERAPGFGSAEVVYVRYDEDILGEGRSIFGSLGAGTRLLKDRLELRLSGDYSADPYFDKDVRGMLGVRYLLDL
jgi:hypothetical protein